MMGSNLMPHLVCRDVLDEGAADVAGAVADGVKCEALDMRGADTMLRRLSMMATVSQGDRGLHSMRTLTRRTCSHLSGHPACCQLFTQWQQCSPADRP